MKVKGVAISLPVCDWRRYLRPEEARLKVFSNRLPTVGTFLRGFGIVKERNIRMPWREQDTVFVECPRAISLTGVKDRFLKGHFPLEDKQRVYRVIRRIYIDDKSLARLELGLFLHPAHDRPRSTNKAEDYARTFWQ